MARRIDTVTGLYEQAVQGVTGSYESWTAFLCSACRNYKCSFDELLLIHEQRPDATAVLTLEDWNDVFGRWVNRGATSIAVFDKEAGNKTVLKHYFDISDTHKTPRSRREVPLWDMEERFEAPVIETLENAFGELKNKDGLAQALISAAENAVEDNLPDYLSDLMLCRENSYLEELDELNVGHIYAETVKNSMAYMLLTRCGFNADMYFEREDFQGVLDFNTRETVNALGIATGDITKTVLLEISSTILNMVREENAQGRTFANQNERVYDEIKENTQGGSDHEHSIHDAGGLQSPRSENAGRAGGDAGQVRGAAPQLPYEPSQGTVYEPADVGQADSALGGDRADSEGARGEDGIADGADRGLDGGAQSKRPDALDGTDEQSSPLGGGERAERPDIQLTPQESTPQAADDWQAEGVPVVQLTPQESTPQAADEAESGALPAFLVEENIWSVLRHDRYMHTKRPEIAAYFETHSDEDERTTFLKKSYNMDVYSELLAGEKRFGYIARDNGVTMWEGSYLSCTSETTFSWDLIQGFIGYLIERGDYLDIPAPGQAPAVQVSLFGETVYEPKRTKKTPAPVPAAPLGISQQIIDEVLCDGGNERYSTLRICAFFKSDRPVEENADFLRAEYGTGGKGFIIDGIRAAVWFDENGIRIAQGETAIESDSSILLSWEQAAKRIRELLDMGRYMPQSDLDRVDRNERKDIAAYIWYLDQDCADGLRLIDRPDGFAGFPEETAYLAGQLSDREQLAAYRERIADFAARYEQDRTILRYHHHKPSELLARMDRLLGERLNFTSQTQQRPAMSKFITQDELDRLLIGNGSVQYRKLAIYAYFLEEYSAKERADFLKRTYGDGGHSYMGFDEWHDSKGMALSRGFLSEPYDKVLMKWPQVAKRIDELIASGRYMSQQELDYIPEYEKRELSRSIAGFFQNKKGCVKPYGEDVDFLNASDAIRPQLDDVERVREIIEMMKPVLDGMQPDDRHYDYDKKAYDNLVAYSEGRFSLFGKKAVLPEMEEPAERDEGEYALQLGAAVYLGAKEYEIYSFDDAVVVLRDPDAPLLLEEMPRSRFETRLRDNPKNDYLLAKEPIPESAEAQPVPRETTVDEMLAFAKRIAEETDVEPHERFTLIETEDGTGDSYGIWDDLHDSYYVDEDGNKAAFLSRFEAEAYLDTLRETTAEKEIADWQYAEQAKLPPLEYAVGDYFVNYDESGNAEFVITDVNEDYIFYAFPDMPEQEPVEMFRDRFEGYLRSGSIRPLIQAEPEQSIVPAWEKKPERVSFTPLPEGEKRDYRITDDALGAGGPKERFQNNIAAIRLLIQLEQEGRLATSDEQEILAKYVGWGGLSEAFDEDNAAWHDEYGELKGLLSEEEYASARESTLTAFYTPPVVIRAMYGAMKRLGLKNANVLEPSCGIGHFFGMLPDDMQSCKLYGVEIDSISGRIAKQLYQNSKIIVQGYENTDIPDSFFDAAIGNVPFGDFKVSDKRYDKLKYSIHDYYFAKTLDKVRPGGVIAFITSSFTMDKENPAVRRYIAQRAELLGAIRLPNNTFKASAGTDVTTDILFLQKRDRVIDLDDAWTHLGTDSNGIPMNSYFIEHPEMVMGEMVMESTRFGPAPACRAAEGVSLSELLADAIANINGEITEPEQAELEQEDISIPAESDVRNFSFAVVDGKIYYRENSRMYPRALSVTGENRMRGLIAIRDCVRRLIEYQTEEYPDDVIKREQAELNRLYDDFINKYGLISSRANSAVFSSDSSFPLLSSLEVLDDNGNLERKADIFFKRTIKPNIRVSHVDTASEALAVSLAEKAKVDLPFMASITGKDEETIIKELEGVIFLNVGSAESQDKDYVTADEYLSGNVREKLKLAKMAQAALNDGSLDINVQALEAVQPKDLSASEISVRLGTTWLPPRDIQQFMYELLDTPRYNQHKIQVHYSKYTGEWNVEGKSADSGNVKAVNTYGTHRMNAYKIIETTLNLREAMVYDYHYDENGRRVAELNKKETAIAQGKQEIIKQAFVGWIWKDPERRQRLTRYYNETFNSHRDREYDGSHLAFPGMNPEIALRKHQVNAVARTIFSGTNSLYAHVVGAGKTFTIVAAAQEMKRLGLCNKSMIVVPNHLTEQWAAEYMQLYPSANILVTTKKDFETKNRKRFCSRIATGDYDAIIIGHSQFEKIPVSYGRQMFMLQRQIDDITAGIAEVKRNNGERFTIKQLEKTKKSLKARLDKLNNQDRKDDVVTFEELGVDRLFVDEADNYKNLFLYTKMRNVGGVAQTEAQKSSDMYMKCRYMDELTGGRGVIFATGTPISNSMVEMYTMQRYLQYHLLEQRNLQHFDAWASTFGETVTAIELAPEGTGYRTKTRFAKFHNLPELMSMFRQVADVQTADMLNLPVPKANYRAVSVKPSDIQENMVESLSERAEKVRAKMVKPFEDNMLLITNDGRKLALDQRLMNELLPDNEGSKLNACVDEVFRFWENGKAEKHTQLLFCDLSTPKNDGTFDVYNDVKNKLLARGVPPSEIAFIHDAHTDVQKKELFAKVRRGQVRILIGSTARMGAGTNVQDRIIASHDLDCPWRPRDLEQRAGRTVRQGNRNPEVDIIRYVTEGTFDAYLYQIIENKQKFIAQVMTSKSPMRSADDIDETALSYAEIKALASGNPLIKEKMDLDIEVSRLQLLKGSYLSQKYELEDSVISYYPKEIKQLSERMDGYMADDARAHENTPPGDAFAPMTLHGAQYDDKKEAGTALIEACKGMKSPDPILVGGYKGFSMILSFDTFSHDWKLTLQGTLSHTITLGTDVFGNIQRIDNALNDLKGKADMCKNKLDTLKQQMETARLEAEKPFVHEEELSQKSARLAELNSLLNMDKHENERADDDPVPEQENEPEHEMAR